ncbi:MAG: cytochrome c oxidase subunit II [Actinobacteria bacterium]|nr:cytochrome c oxidase subunit II [Actinomycetota bacterium]
MTNLQTPQTTKWWKKSDVKKTFLLWLILTPIIGYVGTTVQLRSIGAPASEVMASVKTLMGVFTWAASPVAALVAALALTSLSGKRHYGDNPPADADHQISNSPRVASTWVVVSTLLCLFALITGLVVLQKDNESILDATAMNVNVTGQQWVWNFDYVESNGVRSADLYLPVDKPVVFHVTSVDVKHSFWIVQMGIKMDANPGYVTETAVTPNKIGVFDIRCAELCGLLHAYMQTKVHVLSQADYDAWLTAKSTIEGAA